MSLVIYGLNILISLILTYFFSNEKNVKKKIIWGCTIVVLLSLFASVREGIGTDYFSHQEIFDNLSNGVVVTKHSEIGYLLLNGLIVLIGGNYHWVLFFVTTISVTCILFTFDHFKEDISITFAMFVYLLMFYQMSFNLIRQMLAISIALTAIVFINKNKFFSAFIIVLSSFFHITTLILLPIILFPSFFYESKYDNKRLFMYILLLIIIFTYPLFLIPFLDWIQSKVPQLEYFINYLEVNYQSIGLGVLRYPLLLIFPCVFFYNKMPNYIKICFNTMILGFILWLTSYVTVREFYRISYNLFYISPLLLGYVWKNLSSLNQNISCLISKVKYKEYIFKIYIVILLLFFWYYDFFYLQAHETIPYLTIFH